MAMTTGGETAEFGRKGCHGCYGGCYSSCHVRVRHGCKGCYGGCSVSYGCTGYAGCYGCTGYTSCYGSCGGYVSCYGCTGYVACCGGTVVVPGKPPVTEKKVTGGESTESGSGKGVTGGAAEDTKLKPGTTLSADETKWLKEMMDAEKDPAEKKKIEDDFKKDSHVGRKATYEVYKKMKSGDDSQVSQTTVAMVIVKVPADARVTVDGQATYSTSTVRTFETPELAPGKSYSYVLKAEFQQDGKLVTVSKRVPVAAGKTIRVDLSKANDVVVSR
jgi:uncharacterized protein (TIGR03000 family)